VAGPCSRAGETIVNKALVGGATIGPLFLAGGFGDARRVVVQAWAWWSVRWRLIWWGLIGRALGLVNGGLRVVRGEFDIFGERGA
jgi:hypothetical protein